VTGVYLDERKELHALKKLLGEYGVLEFAQIYAYFAYKDAEVIRGIMSYMTRNALIAADAGAQLAAASKAALANGPDRKLLASFWAMLQHDGEIEYHTRSEYPSQLYFFSGGREYEVVYVALGDENLINSIFSRIPESDTRYLVVVEEPKQLESLYLPRVEWFCTVEGGHVRQYIQED
jgi:hypothetical protein